MGVSLETRVPLDHRVIEFAWTLPMSAKYRENQEVDSWQVLNKYLPKNI